MKNMERRYFLGMLGAAGLTHTAFTSRKLNLQGRTITLKGKEQSKIVHWDIITIGNLSRNRYWGESEEHALHSVICTCTVISGKDFNVIVDPSLEDDKAMSAELKRRRGLTLGDIDAVFVTHEHGDHHAGLENFHRAKWIAGSEVSSLLNKIEKYDGRVESAGSTIFDAIDVVPAPGHTPGSHGLRFDYRGLSIFVAGDAVATKDFWDEGRMYFKALDMAESKRTMQKISSTSDIVVPGHDNYFFHI